MIAFLEGRLAGKTATSALVNVNGVGFSIGMSAVSLSRLPETGSPVEIYTYMHVREDEISLYGFLTMEEKTLFEQLISVSGVGPKVALGALSYYSPQELSEAVATQDVARISKIPGVGKKTASRIILELKGTLEEAFAAYADDGAQAEDSRGVVSEVADALVSMGFTSTEAELALKGAPEDADEGAILQYALKKLGSF